MAKKKTTKSTTSWLVPEEDTQAAAKAAIKKASSQPVSKIGRPEGNTRGPERREEKLTRMLVKDADRKRLKILASMMDETMVDTFSIIIEKAYNERMK